MTNCKKPRFNSSLRIVIVFLLFSSTLVIPRHVNSAAWLQEKGEGLIIGNIQSYTSCKYWDLNSHLQSGPCFHQFSVNPYMEYGIVSKFTIIINPTFLSYNQAGQSSAFNLGYMTIGGRYSLHKKDYSALSVQILYNQPFKSSNFGSNPSAISALSNEEYYIDLRILYGNGGKFNKKSKSKSGNTWYANAEAAIRPYIGVKASELHFDFMLGCKTMKQRLVVEIQELNTISLYKPTNTTKPNFNLGTLMFSAMYWYTPKLGLQAGIKQDFYGTNIGRGTSPFIALWFKI